MTCFWLRDYSILPKKIYIGVVIARGSVGTENRTPTLLEDTPVITQPSYSLPGDGLTLSEGVTLAQGLRLSEGLTLPEGFQPSKWHVGHWDSGGLGRRNTEASRLVIVISVALLFEAPPAIKNCSRRSPRIPGPYETFQGISAFHITFVVL